MTATHVARNGKARRVLTLSAILALVLVAPLRVAAQSGTPPALFGLRFGGAQERAAYLDLLHVTQGDRRRWQAATLEIEGGRRAGQIGIGIAGAGNRTPSFHSQTVVMRTWKGPTDLAPAQTYVGAEVQLSLLVGVSFARYWRVNGNAPGQSRYHAVRFVVGF